ncbi:hypothetical protein IW150_005716, partial [Coemansia sp. RSA 2607]
MVSSALKRKRTKEDGSEDNLPFKSNKGRRTGTRTNSQRDSQSNFTSNSFTNTPYSKRSGHMQGHTAECVPIDYLLKERKAEAQIAVSESIITHKLLQVVKPRKRTVANKAENVSDIVAKSLENYIKTLPADDKATTDLDLERVRRFCAPHNNDLTRFAKESEMYPAIDALLGFISEKIRDNTDDGGDLKNGISVFANKDFTVPDGDTSLRIDKALRIDFDGLGEFNDEDVDTKGGNADMSMTTTYANIFAVIEAKIDNQAKVEDETNPKVITNDAERVDATMQLYLYTHNIYFRQHARRFAWGFTVCGSVFQACLFTHDIMVRSGGIDVATGHGRKGLVELFTNMSFCDKDQLGYDPTIIFNDAEQWEMQVFENGEPRRCIINEVLLAADRAFGRHTRCFHCKTIPESGSKEEPRDVLVKDAWAHQKSDLNENEDARNEATLLRLISDGFCNDTSLENKYPKLWAGGIVQQTDSASNVSDDSTDYIFAALDQDVREKIPNRVHKRLAMEPLGEPLRMAKVVDETIIAVEDAMEVYMAAWKGHGIMHRDISTSNILIRRDSQTGKLLNGALIDFDCAIMVTDDEPRTDQRPNMAGTFPFMSINCLAASSGTDLCNSCVPRTILDDWESALYVLCWLGTFGINYHDSAAAKHKISETNLPIGKWRTGSPEDVARNKMSDLTSRKNLHTRILRWFYEPPLLESLPSEPLRAVSVS